jgi:23S rRNA pseudouridine1911/1915/1917 synthase
VTPPTTHELLVGESDTGERLDRYLASHLPELSRTRIQELIEAELVLVGGKPTKGSHRLRAGEKLSVEAQARPPMLAEAEDIPLHILYLDDDVIVVNKAAGMTVHAGAGNPRGTLVNALLGMGQKLASGGDALRPGIVHRLDKETSGVILVAKNDHAHGKVSESFRQRTVKKTYLALVEGVVEEKQGRIDFPIGRDLHRRTRMTAFRDKLGSAMRESLQRSGAREARTDWQVLATVDGTTLVEVQLHTGRTHQIRVHFAAIKHPVVGDTLYGAAEQVQVGATGGGDAKGSSGKGKERILMPPLGRNFLHAAKLGFTQPKTGAWIEVKAPLPAELTGFLKKLTEAAGEDWKRIDASLAPYL